MRKIEIDGVKINIESGLTPPPVKLGREKGPIRKLCESLDEGESAYLPVSAEAIQRANLTGIGQAIGAKFAYRAEGSGVRVYRLANEATPKKRQLWAA